MVEDQRQSLEAGPEQLLYARILEKGMYFGLVILLITYVIYVLEIMNPYLPLSEVPRYWGLSVSEYLHHAKIQPGWAWVGMLRYGDFLNFIGIAMLAGVSIICFMAIVPSLWRSGDRIYAVFAVTEVIILTVAASGILGTGGH